MLAVHPILFPVHSRPLLLLQVKKNPSSITTPILLKRQGLLDAVGNLFLDNTKPQMECVKKHCLVIKHGVALASQMEKLQSLGTPDERARKDKKRTLVNQVLNCGKAFIIAKGDLLSFAKQHVDVDQGETQNKEVETVT